MRTFGGTLAAVLVVGQAALAGDLQAVADRLLETTGAPGLAVAVLRDGEAELAVAGVRKLGAATPVAADDLWHIGSMTKSMTATLTARLAEAGRIGWGDTIGEVLGDRLADLHPEYRDKTYVELLAHRSRIRPNLSLWQSLSLQGTEAERDLIADRQRYAENVLAKPPGADGYLYSNAGFVVAAAMIEATTGTPWERLMQEEVFAPLGVNSAGFGAPGRADALDQPRGHRKGWVRGLRPVEPGPVADNIPALGPAGTVHLSAGDVLRYLDAHLTRDPAFLSQASWDRLHLSPAGWDYVAGWVIGSDGVLWHNGSNTMWYAVMAFVPGKDTAFAVLTNSGDIASVEAAITAEFDALLDR